MPFYKTIDNKLHFLDSEEFENILPPGCVQITDEEAETLRQPPPPTTEQIVAGFVAAMEAHYDAVARVKNYDNRFTCALRAGYAGPFQSEGQAFAIWMDGCNALAYSVLAEVQAGTRSQPTVAEFIAMLPVAPW